MKIFKCVASIFGWIIAGSLLIVLLFNVIDRSTTYRTPLFGYRATAIVSESMQTVNPDNTYVEADWERINKGDVVITKTCSYEDLQEYDVITYLNSKGVLICHRVIKLYEENGNKYILTRGDANNANDMPIKAEALRGRVTTIWRGVGDVVMFVTSLYFLLAVFMSIFFIGAGYVVYYILKNKKEKGEQIKDEK